MKSELRKPRPRLAWVLLLGLAAIAAYVSTDDWVARVAVVGFLVGGPAIWLKRQQMRRQD